MLVFELERVGAVEDYRVAQFGDGAGVGLEHWVHFFGLCQLLDPLQVLIGVHVLHLDVAFLLFEVRVLIILVYFV